MRASRGFGLAELRRLHLMWVVLALTLFPVLTEAQSLHAVSFNPVTVTGGGSTTCTVTLSKPAVGEVDIPITNPHSFVHLPGAAQIPDGQSSISFAVPVDAIKTTRSTTVTFTDGTHTRSASIQVLKTVALASVSVSAPQVVAGSSAVGAIRLTSVAGSGGFVVQLSSSRSFVQVPSMVTIPAASQTATFAVSTTTPASEGSVTLSCTANGFSLKASLKVTKPPLALSFSPSKVRSGSSAVGTVQLEFGASTSTVVHLACDQPFVHIPPTVTLSKGQSAATFTATTDVMFSTACANLSAESDGVVATTNLAVEGLDPWPNAGHDSQRSGHGFGSGSTGQIVDWTATLPSFGSNSYDMAIGADGTSYVELYGDLFDEVGGGLVAYNGDGTIRWLYDGGGWTATAPELWGNLVISQHPIIDRYYGSASAVFAVSQATGFYVWGRILGGTDGLSPLISSHGLVFTGGSESGGNAFDFGREQIHALNAATGAVVWETEVPAYQEGSTRTETVSAVALSPDEATVYGITYGSVSESIASRLVALDASTGAVRWISNLPLLSNGPLTVGPDGAMYLLEYSAGTGALVAFDPATGAPKWSAPVPVPNSQHLYALAPTVGADNSVIVGIATSLGDPDGRLTAVKPDGTQLWTKIYLEPLGRLSIDQGGVLYFAGKNAVHAINSVTGDGLWDYSVPDGVYGIAIGSDNHLFYLGAKHLIYVH